VTNTWLVARESKEWVGPITITATVNGGTPVTIDPAEIQFAVLPRGQRPVDTDWTAPVADPDGGTAVGVQADPVTAYAAMGIWAKFTDDPNVPVLEPDEIGYLTRT
jgi:hypothetical protein